MKMLRSLTMIAALATSTVAFADTPPPAKAPAADKKAPAPVADKKAPPAPVKEEISQADAEAFLAFFNKVADAMVVNKDDCTKLAAAINKLTDDNAPLLKKANDAKSSGKKLPKALEDKMMARVKDMMPAMQKCQADKGVNDAMKRMDGGGGKADKAPATPPATKTDAKKPATAPAKP